MVRTDNTPRLSEKFTFAISPETKQRIKKLPREVQLGYYLRAAMDKILGDLDAAIIQESLMNPQLETLNPGGENAKTNIQ